MDSELTRIQLELLWALEPWPTGLQYTDLAANMECDVHRVKAIAERLAETTPYVNIARFPQIGSAWPYLTPEGHEFLKGMRHASRGSYDG